jgi:hypothetical protein
MNEVKDMGTHAKPRRKVWPWVVAAFVVAPVATVIALGASHSPSTTVAPAPIQAVPTQSASVPALPTEPAPRTQVLQAPGLPPVTHELPANQWGAGTYEVGNGDYEIPPGKYHTDAKGSYGYWARLKGTDGEMQSIIANGMPTGPTTITVKPTDTAVTFSGDYIWTQVGSK